MKKYTIGRGDDSDIIVSDPKGLVSRHHALLKAYPNGGYELIDLSKNGTFVNGIRIAAHKPVKVKRKDVIVFANSSKLEWEEVPEPYKWVKLTAMIGIGIAIVLLALLATRLAGNEKPEPADFTAPQPAIINSSPDGSENREANKTESPDSRNETESGIRPESGKDSEKSAEEEQRSRRQDSGEKSRQNKKKQQEPEQPNESKEAIKAPGGD